jgi:hypothetical protein
VPRAEAIDVLRATGEEQASAAGAVGQAADVAD